MVINDLADKIAERKHALMDDLLPRHNRGYPEGERHYLLGELNGLRWVEEQLKQLAGQQLRAQR